MQLAHLALQSPIIRGRHDLFAAAGSRQRPSTTSRRRAGFLSAHESGGINPDAVNWMWRMQGGYGRVVWFPTFDADNHVKHFKDAPEGIKVLGADGKVLPAVRDVLKICAEQKLVVHTGHL